MTMLQAQLQSFATFCSLNVEDGKSQRVMVLDEGFAWNGTTYRSLTEIAFAITGTRWSGPRFFGLRREKPA